MAVEAEVEVPGNTAVGNTDSQETTAETTPKGPPAEAALTEPLTPRAALERLKARRELAQQEAAAPAPPATPEKSAGVAKAVDEDDVEGLLGTTFEEPAGEAVDGVSPPNDDDPFVFEVDGKQITRSEGQKGYLRHQDFTVRTQGLAEVRRTFETEIQQASADRTRYGTLLGDQLTALKQNQPQRPDPVMKNEDPLGYNERLVEYLAYQEEVRNREVQIDQLVREQRQSDQKLFELKRAEEAAKMLEAVPSLKSAKTEQSRGKLLARFKQTALDAGYAENELSRLIDHRVVRILEWATIGRAMQKGTIKTSKTAGKSAPSANGSNGNGTSPPLLPSQSLKSTGGGGGPNPNQTVPKDVKEAEEAFTKRSSLREGVALLKAKRAARQRNGEV